MSIRETQQKKSAIFRKRLTIHSTIRHRVWSKWCWRRAALNIANWTNSNAHGTVEMGCKDGLVSNLFNKAFYLSRLKPRRLSRARAQEFCNGGLAHWFSYLTTLWKDSGISRNRKMCIIWMNLASCRTTDRTQNALKEKRRRVSFINRCGQGRKCYHWIWTYDEQEPACRARKNLHQRRWSTVSQLVRRRRN
jgi:hypothetical protein